MKGETLKKYQKSMEELQETVNGTVSELKAAVSAGEGLGGAALFAERLEKEAAALQEFAKKQKEQ